MTHSIFRPLTIRQKTLGNRIVFGAHTTNMADDGLPGARMRAYYEARARGGAAMIVFEPMPVHATAVLTSGNFRHSDDVVIPAFAQLTSAIKQHDTVVLQQLYHVGQHGDADLSFQPNWSPSGLPSYHDSDGSHAMTLPEIDDVIDGYVAAALRCKKAGFDGVEVWAAYHSLIEQFLTPWSNKRDDDYGGSLENRMRFGTRILEGIRAACGDDFIIGYSISTSEKTDFLLSTYDHADILQIWDDRKLIDYVSVGSGNYLDYDAVMPTFVHAENLSESPCKVLRSILHHAVVTTESHIRTPENAHELLRHEDADLVSIVRGQIADPEWVNKVAAGTPERLRRCISCNQMCWGRRSRDYWISCLVNPAVGREYTWQEEPYQESTSSQHVTIVGGGPAGLEAARVAAERGYEVILHEATGHLGGQFRLAGLTPRRGQIQDLIAWYEDELVRLGVTMHFHNPVDAYELSATVETTLVLATGSLPDPTASQRWLPQHEELPGLEHGQVVSPEAILNREAEPGKAVVMVDEGGNWRSLGTAWSLAERGHQVTIVTPDAMIGKELVRTTADFPVRQALVKLGTQFITESVLTRWHGGHASIRSLLDQSTRTIAASTLVMATTNRANDQLAQDLGSMGRSFHAIGDGVAPRNAAHAIYEGRKLGLSL